MSALHSIAPACSSSPVATPQSLLARLGLMLRVAHSRRTLRGLPEDRLDDLGISADEARVEAARPIWDVPCTWRS